MRRWPFLVLLLSVLTAAGAAFAWRAARGPASNAGLLTRQADGGGSDVGGPSRVANRATTSDKLDGDVHPPVANAWFVEVTNESGVEFVHQTGTSAEKPFPAANGSGLGALDYDLDGRYDLYFATGTPFPLDARRTRPANALYRNLGGWRFVDVSASSGLNHAGFTAGVTVGDYDADGFPDVYLSCYGPNVLMRNQGDGTFQPVTDAGVDDPRWATSSAMLDYDNDGLLDLYVGNYARWTWETNQFCGDRARNIRIYCSPHSVEAEQDILYRNQGDGTFVDRTAEAGLTGAAGRAQGVVVADLDDDGWVDVYVGNDLHANRLLLNRRDGTFRDASESSGTAYDFQGNRQAGMGVAAGDTNGDGRLDLLVTNFQGEHNALYENLGRGLFTEVADPRGLAASSRPWVGWGTALADFNLDGWLDAVVTNGHVDDNRHLLGQSAPYAAPPLLWLNQQGRFQLLGRQAGAYFEQTHVGRALAVVDLDNDGDQDLVIGHQDARPALLRNERLPHGQAWESGQPSQSGLDATSLVVRLIGRRGNRDAVGATLTLHAGPRRAVRHVSQSGSYLSAHDIRQVFAALPGETSLRLDIRWPGGGQNSLDGLPPGRHYVVLEPLDTSPPTLIETWTPSHEP